MPFVKSNVILIIMISIYRNILDLGYHSTTAFENKYWTGNQKGEKKVKYKHIWHEKEIRFR